ATPPSECKPPHWLPLRASDCADSTTLSAVRAEPTQPPRLRAALAQSTERKLEHFLPRAAPSLRPRNPPDIPPLYRRPRKSGQGQLKKARRQGDTETKRVEKFHWAVSLSPCLPISSSPCLPVFLACLVSDQQRASRELVHGIVLSDSMIHPPFVPTLHPAVEGTPMRYRPAWWIWLSVASAPIWVGAGPGAAQSSGPWQRVDIAGSTPSLSVGAQVPLDEIPAGLRTKVRAVMEKPTLSTRGQTETFNGEPRVYQWLLD